MIRILIVEDQAMLRDSLTLAINSEEDMAVVGAIADAANAVATAMQSEASLVLMDALTENDSSGIDAARELKQVAPSIRVVVMTGTPEVGFIGRARNAGVDSFVYKNVGTEELLTVIRSTSNGYSTYPTAQLDMPGFSDLTDEELQILRLVCETKSRREIASELYLSEGTVKRRISDILAKTGYESAMKLAVHAVSNGWIVPSLGRD